MCLSNLRLVYWICGVLQFSGVLLIPGWRCVYVTAVLLQVLCVPACTHLDTQRLWGGAHDSELFWGSLFCHWIRCQFIMNWKGEGGERRKGKNWERKRKEERESAASFTPHKCSQLWRNWLKMRRERVRKTVKGSVKRERELREWKLDWEGKGASLQDWSIMTSQEN